MMPINPPDTRHVFLIGFNASIADYVRKHGLKRDQFSVINHPTQIAGHNQHTARVVLVYGWYTDSVNVGTVPWAIQRGLEVKEAEDMHRDQSPLRARRLAEFKL